MTPTTSHPHPHRYATTATTTAMTASNIHDTTETTTCSNSSPFQGGSDDCNEEIDDGDDKAKMEIPANQQGDNNAN